LQRGNRITVKWGFFRVQVGNRQWGRGFEVEIVTR